MLARTHTNTHMYVYLCVSRSVNKQLSLFVLIAQRHTICTRTRTHAQTLVTGWWKEFNEEKQKPEGGGAPNMHVRARVHTSTHT